MEVTKGSSPIASSAWNDALNHQAFPKSHRVSGRTHVVEEVVPCHDEGDEGISSPKPYFTNWSKSVG